MSTIAKGQRATSRKSAADSQGMREMTSAHRRRVLIVEDEPDALEILKDWIKTQGWHVRTARSGQEALEISKSFQPDVLITDYLLQDDVTGVDVITQLKSGGTKVRCVLVTGMLQNALLEGVHRIHGIPILTKPFDFQRLGELISNS
jgi:two-component system OmpR family response regulator